MNQRIQTDWARLDWIDWKVVKDGERKREREKERDE